MFPVPHRFCLAARSLIFVTATADILIALAYYVIPFLLLRAVKSFSSVLARLAFAAFASFIYACGTTHVMEVWNLWHTDYWLAAWVKITCAFLSVGTAAAGIYVVRYLGKQT